MRACKSGFFSDFFYFNKIKYILNTFFHFTKIKYICCIFRGMKNYPKTQIKNYQKRYEITACLWWCLAGILCTVILYSTPVLFAVQRWGTIFIADVKCAISLFVNLLYLKQLLWNEHHQHRKSIKYTLFNRWPCVSLYT